MTLRDLREHPDYRNAACPVNKLCSYKKIRDEHDVLIEVCEFCNRKVRYNKIDGRIDFKQYGRDHIRDLLQRGTRLFEEIYGYRPPIKQEQKLTREQWRDMARDTYRTVEKLEAKGQLDRA